MMPGFGDAGAERFEPLPAFGVGEIIEPGTYVDPGSGRLYRVSAEDVTGEIHLPIPSESSEVRYIRISRNPFLVSVLAREICRAHGIPVNF